VWVERHGRDWPDALTQKAVVVTDGRKGVALHVEHLDVLIVRAAGDNGGVVVNGHGAHASRVRLDRLGRVRMAQVPYPHVAVDAARDQLPIAELVQRRIHDPAAVLCQGPYKTAKRGSQSCGQLPNKKGYQSREDSRRS